MLVCSSPLSILLCHSSYSLSSSMVRSLRASMLSILLSGMQYVLVVVLYALSLLPCSSDE